jgi:hypothetical protein
VRCHSGPKVRGDFDFVVSTPQLIAKDFVIPSDGAHSEIAARVEAGEMLPPRVRPQPGAAEISARRAFAVRRVEGGS